MPAMLESAAPQMMDKPPLAIGVRLRLSIMMLLQFGVWGAFFVVFNVYLGKTLKFDGAQVGTIYATIPLGAIVSMMFAGQLADRVLASEWLLAIFHLAGGVMLWVIAQQTTYAGVLWSTFAWALLYNPTLAISNSLAFANIPDATRDFPTLRVLGTIGWIIAASSTDWFLPPDAAFTSKPLLVGAGVSVALGLFSLLLPHTPPSGAKGGMFPFLKAIGLLRDANFAIFFGLTFVITIALAFYYTFTSPFLTDVGVTKIGSTMSLGQWSEIGFMLLLPLGLKRLGMKTILAIGMGAWVVRYGVFAIAHNGSPFPLIVLGVLLHGVCFDFFLAAGFIHTDNNAPSAIRGSAQALFSFIVYGAGMYVGTELSGQIVKAYTPAGGPPKWQMIWTIPAIGAAVCLLAFLIFWKNRPVRVEETVDGRIPSDAYPTDSTAAVGSNP